MILYDFPYELSAYNGAIIRIVTAFDDETKTNNLFFANVELLSKSRHFNHSIELNHSGIPHSFFDKKSKFKLAFRIVYVSTEYAISWYRDLTKSPIIPVPKLESEIGSNDGKSIEVSKIVDEPKWPHLSTPVGKSEGLSGSYQDFPTPFIGSASYPFKIHRQVASLTNLQLRILNSAKAKEWLEKRIYFDVSLYDEFVGGAILVVPDPDVHSISTFMSRDDNENEYLVGQVLAHKGRKLTGLKLTIFEKRFGAIGTLKCLEVDDNLFKIEMPNQIEASGYFLTHKERGLISYQEALPFLRSFQTQFEIAEKKISIEVVDSRKKKSTISKHEFTQYSNSSVNSIVELEKDNENTRDIVSRYYKNSHRREQIEVANNQQLQWFDTREVAADFIRKLISKARIRVMIVDPYADRKDMYDFGHFISRKDTKLQILTSHLAPLDNQDASFGFKHIADDFSARDLQTPEIRILPGKDNPPLHDRFIIIDDAVWHSGNSLNSIGKKASIFFRLPNPEFIIDKIISLYEISKPIVL